MSQHPDTSLPIIDVESDQADASDAEQALATLDAAPPTLAWDRDARRFPVPSPAVAWCVFHRSGSRGRPRPVYGNQGPAIVPLDGGFDDLRAAVNGVPGSYILQAVDEYHQPVPNVPSAYVQVTEIRTPALATPPPSPAETARVDALDRLTRTVEQLAARCLEREQALADIAAAREKTLVDAFVAMTERRDANASRMMESAAQLLMASRATTEVASGLRLPATPPAPEPERGVFDFLSSPAGGAAVATLGSALKTALENKE